MLSLTLLQMKFNADVLDVILKFLDARSDVSAMMRSFRTAYAFGAKYLLKQHIEITSSEELLSFCYFMQADLVSRAPHLRQLHLQAPFASESTLSKRGLFTDATNEGVRLLVTILRRATRLQHLSIDFCEGLLRRDERLVSAVSDCTSLYSLQVSSIDTSAHRLLASLQSSLNVLDVDFGNECLLPFSRFLDIIARQPALERLTAWYLDLTSTDGAQAIQRCSKRRSFPSIHTLSLRSFDGLDLSSLHAAFPNVRDLTLAGYAVPNPAHTLDDLRKANAAYSLKRVWGSKEHGLDVLAGDAAALYALGAPACRARTLIVSHALDAAASAAALQVSTIIRDAHPFRLVLHLGYGPEDTNVATWAGWNWATEVCDIFGFLRALAAHLGAEPAGRLTHLALDFCTSTIGGPIGAPELKVRLLSSSYSISALGAHGACSCFSRASEYSSCAWTAATAR